MFPRVKNMANTTIKTFNNFAELNEFLSRSSCVVKSIDPGACRIYIEIEEVVETTSVRKDGDPETIIQEVVNLKLVGCAYETPYYDKFCGRALVDYLRSYRNADVLLAVIIAGLKCSKGEGDNLRLYLAGEKFDSFYVK